MDSNISNSIVFRKCLVFQSFVNSFQKLAKDRGPQNGTRSYRHDARTRSRHDLVLLARVRPGTGTTGYEVVLWTPGEGLKLVAFFVAAQHLFVAYYEGDPDFAVYMGELRDRFFDETSCWCLPTKILELTEEQSNSIGIRI